MHLSLFALPLCLTLHFTISSCVTVSCERDHVKRWNHRELSLSCMFGLPQLIFARCFWFLRPQRYCFGSYLSLSTASFPDTYTLKLSFGENTTSLTCTFPQTHNKSAADRGPAAQSQTVEVLFCFQSHVHGLLSVPLV